MEIEIAVAKTHKYATIESGDTLEAIERPNGGYSVVLSDGQTSGRGAKLISSMVVRKVISLLADGVRDGAAARAASDYLYTERGGKVSACLNILSVDLQTYTIVLARNNPTPIFISHNNRVECLSGESTPIGTSRNIRPVITEIPIENGMTVVLYTDGILHAGERFGTPLDTCALISAIMEELEPHAQQIADSILNQASQLDHNRPNDDMSVVVLRVMPRENDHIRRLSLRLPVDYEPPAQ
jgi:serine phosphatase RsbU (regulator of sigma subunit)